MFVAGTHVPVRDPRLRPALRTGLVRVAVVGVAACVLGYAAAQLVGISHAPLYAVLMASSSAALVLPIVDSLALGGRDVVELLPQVAVADAACIVLLPLVIDPDHVARAALGALGRAAGRRRPLLWRSARSSAAACAAGCTTSRRTGSSRSSCGSASPRCSRWRPSRSRVHVSLMLAGFVSGLAVAAVGEPRRVAKQLFAVTEGFFGPLFFVWLGAGLQLRDLVDHPSMVVLGRRARGRARRSPTWSPSRCASPRRTPCSRPPSSAYPSPRPPSAPSSTCSEPGRGSRDRAGRAGRPRGHCGGRLAGRAYAAPREAADPPPTRRPDVIHHRPGAALTVVGVAG